MSNRKYLSFPTRSNNASSLKRAQQTKTDKNGSLKSKESNIIKYDINDNKSKSKFNQIISDKINKTATHNLIHNPSIQKHKTKSPQSILKNRHKIPANPDEKWKCAVCTYQNISIMAYCEICEAKKTDNSKQASNDNNSVDEDGDFAFNDDSDTIPEYVPFDDYAFAKELMVKESENIPNYKRSYSNDEEIARKLQEQMNESKDLEMKQKELEDTNLAKKIQSQLEEEERQLKLKKHKEDEAIAQRLQREHEQELLQFEKQKLANETAALVLQAKEDMDSAKFYEKKQKEDETRMRSDESFALKMQRELNKGAAWFCNSCFSVNMDITQFKCELCDSMRPKPAIPKYIMSMRDDLATHIINAIREVPGHIVNITFVQNFIVKYFKMCEEIGTVLSYPKIVYHWTKSSNFDPIAKTGLKVPDGVALQHQTDTGYYGRGIYTSPDPKYAQGYGHGANKLFVCLSIPGRQYSASYPAMLGKPLKDGYDSHVSDDRGGMEWVFFSSDQLLLCYLVTLDFLESKAKTQMDYVCQFLESKFSGMREEKLNKLTKDDV